MSSKIPNVPTDITSPNTQETPHYCRLTRYVHNSLKNLRQYKSCLINLSPSESLLELQDQDTEDNFVFARMYIPKSHYLTTSNYNLTLEDLKNKLETMDIFYPLCFYANGNNIAARLNFLHSMEKKVDGQDYLMLVFVASDELQDYKKMWPSQILVELPFASDAPNWKDLYRQAIKVFAQTLEVEYAFLLEDNCYAAYGVNDDGEAPVSMLEYLQNLQQAAVDTGAPAVGSRVAGLSDELSNEGNAWSAGPVSAPFLLRSDISANFTDTEGDDEYDVGLTAFNDALANEGTVQISQYYVLRRGYSIEDPVEVGTNQTLLTSPTFSRIRDLEPEQTGINLRVVVVENEVLVDRQFSDGSSFRRSLAVVADESASIVFLASNDQIELFEPGNTLQILNGKVIMYEGWMRVTVNDQGNVLLDDLDEDIEPNTRKCVSTVEYELI